MINDPSVHPAVADAVAHSYRNEWAYVLAATVRVTADLDIAEECTQSAFAKALTSWTETSIPDRPGAWLTTAARHAAIDLKRRQSTMQRKLPLLIEPEDGRSYVWGATRTIDDDRLRLIFTCCHPALGEQSQIALTLRLVCGLSTTEVARAFLVSESTMAARITRAKRKISQARIPYRTPEHHEIETRLAPVLQVVHLVFTTGHAAPDGDELFRSDLLDRSFALARMLHELLPLSPSVGGLLALILLTDARREGRTNQKGLVLLSEQDRARWNQSMIDEGCTLIDEFRRVDEPNFYILMAAISREHCVAATWNETNWPSIVQSYDVLMSEWPSPVLALNRAVAIGFTLGAEAGLSELESLTNEPQLANYPYFSVARGDFMRRLGRITEARKYYDEAILLTENHAERQFLERQLYDLVESDVLYSPVNQR